jgi:tetratricopeptide (TPR) repeat protein
MSEKVSWDRVREVFGRALDIDPVDRPAFVRTECGDDLDLAERITSLLEAHEELEVAGTLDRRLEPGLDPALSLELLAEETEDVDQHLGRYRIIRRAAAGGMGVVYLARDERLDRPVALKLLPRWRTRDREANRRLEAEARAASSLDHPNLATIYEIEESDDGRLFIAMAWYEGGTLRERLTDGPLPVATALEIAAQVADGLAAAHRRGITHRDIKPENIAFGRGDRPIVVDFGLASAVSRQPGGPGVAGTPAYASPEQSLGGPVDDRTDIWSLGVVLYEMLAGRRPFVFEDREALADAIRTKSAPRLDALRSDVPESVADLVARCLAKEADDRIGAAEDLVAELRAAAARVAEAAAPARAPSGPTGWVQELHAGVLPAAAAYIVAAWLTYLLSVELAEGVGLPMWVPAIALLLLLIGLPIVVLTAFVQRGGPRFPTTGLSVSTRPAGGIASALRRLTWRRSLGAGLLAFGFLGAAAVGYTGMRTLGIGPLGTLEARGLIDQREPILLADFATHGADDLLGRTVTEALRIDLLQSSTLQLAEPRALADALQRMGRQPDSVIPEGTALELAEREGIKAVIVGEVASLGGGFVLTARVLATRDRSVLAAMRETARDSSGLIDAVDRLSKRVRERVGEPLRALNAAEPLPRVATASLPALRKYAEGARLSAHGGDDARTAALMEEAVAIDSMFAAAYRALSIAYWNQRADQGRIVQATRRAFQLRARLPEHERLLVEATYYQNILADMEQAGRVYARVLELNPDDMAARNNLALSHMFGGRPVEAEVILRQAPPDAPAMLRMNLADALLFQDRVDEALEVLDIGVAAHGESPLWAVARIRILGAAWRWGPAEAAARAAMIDHADNAQVRMHALRSLWHLALVRGRLEEAERHFEQLLPVIEAAGATEVLARVRLQRAEAWLTLLGDEQRARDEVLAIMGEMDLLAAGAVIVPRAAATLAGAGATREAAELLRVWEAQPPEMRAHISYYSEEKAWARIALSEGDPAGAVQRLERAAADPVNYINVEPDLAVAYRRASQPERAIASIEGYLERRHSRWLHRVPPYLGPALLQLSELYEETGQNQRAAEAYDRFVELWRDADPALQQLVRHAASRAAALRTAETNRLPG